MNVKAYSKDHQIVDKTDNKTDNNSNMAFTSLITLCYSVVYEKHSGHYHIDGFACGKPGCL
jgi:hypothetical protein